MSDEMVTIEVPVEWAKITAEHGKICAGCYQPPVIESCRKALEARKTKYERWRERIQPYSKHFQPGHHRFAAGEERARLMAAAPQLLEALIEAHELAKERGLPSPREVEIAIRAALPPEVAEEVLGE